MISNEGGALLGLKVVSLRMVELGSPLIVTVCMATCRGYVLLLEATSMFTPSRVPVTPAVKVCATKAQHSLIRRNAVLGEVKDWSIIGCATNKFGRRKEHKRINPQKTNILILLFIVCSLHCN